MSGGLGAVSRANTTFRAPARNISTCSRCQAKVPSMTQEIDDTAWFARHPGKDQRIRTTTTAERDRYQRPFTVVTKQADGSVEFTYEFGEI